MKPSISIIIPVLNEAIGIRSFLEHVRQNATGAEIVVADGGSTDGTDSIASHLADQVLITRPNRAVQMNVGVAASSGDILWFLHADVRIPSDALKTIQEIMSDKEVLAGFFRIRLPGSNPVYRLTDSFAHYLGLVFRMRCGDHGLFCRRSAFLELGGFPEVPLMEDAELFRKLMRYGRVRWSQDRLTVSPRRYQQIGAMRLTFFYGFIGALFAIGVPSSTLARIYTRYCQPPAK